jgi:hypothetical protein
MLREVRPFVDDAKKKGKNPEIETSFIVRELLARAAKLWWP